MNLLKLGLASSVALLSVSCGSSKTAVSTAVVPSVPCANSDFDCLSNHLLVLDSTTQKVLNVITIPSTHISPTTSLKADQLPEITTMSINAQSVTISWQEPSKLSGQPGFCYRFCAANATRTTCNTPYQCIDPVVSNLKTGVFTATLAYSVPVTGGAAPGTLLQLQVLPVYAKVGASLSKAQTLPGKHVFADTAVQVTVMVGGVVLGNVALEVSDASSGTAALTSTVIAYVYKILNQILGGGSPATATVNPNGTVTVVLPAVLPSSHVLLYPVPPIATIDSLMSPIIPTTKTNVSNCAAASLPTGLSIDADTCQISGFPREVINPAVVYPITATGLGASVGVSIEVDCSLDTDCNVLFPTYSLCTSGACGQTVVCASDAICVSDYPSTYPICNLSTDTYHCDSSTNTCNDHVKDGHETDSDCGGSDRACFRCANGLACAANGDCVSGTCTGFVCASPS